MTNVSIDASCGRKLTNSDNISQDGAIFSYCAFAPVGLPSALVFLRLTIPLNQYDTFVKKIDTASPAYEVLRKGVFERQIKSDHFERVMNVMCDAWEAEMLLDLANHVYPDLPRRSLGTSLARALIATCVIGDKTTQAGVALNKVRTTEL